MLQIDTSRATLQELIQARGHIDGVINDKVKELQVTNQRLRKKADKHKYLQDPTKLKERATRFAKVPLCKREDPLDTVLLLNVPDYINNEDSISELTLPFGYVYYQRKQNDDGEFLNQAYIVFKDTHDAKDFCKMINTDVPEMKAFVIEHITSVNELDKELDDYIYN
jgi:hypothetical protein